MDNLSEKSKLAENGVSGIKERRLKILKENYITPVLIDFKANEISKGECSDMSSGSGCCGVAFNPCLFDPMHG